MDEDGEAASEKLIASLIVAVAAVSAGCSGV